MDVTG